jgi:DNA-binding NtrC family response regulator
MNSQILLVDDDLIQSTVRNTILSRSGFRVVVARQADEAMLLLERPELLSSLRLMITDHLMPGMNGPELVKHLRTILPSLPVLVLSGLADAESEYEGLQVSFQLKPFPPEEMIRMVNLLLGNPILRSA